MSSNDNSLAVNSSSRPVVRAAIYKRVSSEQQATDKMVSLDVQEANCRSYIEQQGWELTTVYEDAGISGTLAANADARLGRPGLHRLEQDAALPPAKRPFDVVVVFNHTRLARDTAVSMAIFQKLEKENNIPVVSVSMGVPVDPLTFRGRRNPTRTVVNAVGSFLGELEMANLIERTQAAKHRHTERGRWVGTTAPYGYKKRHILDEETGAQERLLEPDPVEFPVLCLIFQWLLPPNLLSARQIASRLETLRLANPTRYPTRTGGEWGRNTIDAIARNKFYAGILSYGKRQKTKTGDGKILTRFAAPGEISHGTHNYPTPITYEQFQELQKIIAGRKQEIVYEGRSPRSFQSRNPLSGIIKCGHCGARMKMQISPHTYQQKTGKKETKDYYNIRYFCRRKTNNEILCPATVSPSISADDLFSHIIEAIDEIAQSPLNARLDFITVGGTGGTFNNSLVLEAEREKNELISYEKELAELIRKESNLDDALEDGTISRAKYRERLGKIEERRQLVTNEINRLQIKQERSELTKKDIERKLLLLESWDELVAPVRGVKYKDWTDQDTQTMKLIFKDLLSCVEVHAFQCTGTANSKRFEIILS